MRRKVENGNTEGIGETSSSCCKSSGTESKGKSRSNQTDGLGLKINTLGC